MTTASQATVFEVDDDAMRSSLRRPIESINLKVRTFASALEYLGAFDPDAPGCLVLDVRMPGMELLDRLADYPMTPPPSSSPATATCPWRCAPSSYDALTPREQQVMELVVAGVSNKNIATELDIRTRTVEIHRSRIMEKRRARSLADLVQASLQLQSRSSGGNDCKRLS